MHQALCGEGSLLTRHLPAGTAPTSAQPQPLQQGALWEALAVVVLQGCMHVVAGFAGHRGAFLAAWAAFSHQAAASYVCCWLQLRQVCMHSGADRQAWLLGIWPAHSRSSGKAAGTVHCRCPRRTAAGQELCCHREVSQVAGLQGMAPLELDVKAQRSSCTTCTWLLLHMCRAAVTGSQTGSMVMLLPQDFGAKL